MGILIKIMEKESKILRKIKGILFKKLIVDEYWRMFVKFWRNLEIIGEN